MNACDLAKSVFYYHSKTLDKPDVYAEIKTKIKEIFHLHKGRYGYRRITLALRNLGMIINRKKVQRLMRVLNLKSKVRPNRYNSYKGQEGESVTNLLKRDLRQVSPIKSGSPMLLSLM